MDTPELNREASPRRRPRGWVLWLGLALLAVAFLYSRRPAKSAVTWHRDLEQAVETASAQDRLIVIDFYAPGCTGCEYMDRNVFSQTVVADALESWVPVKLNAMENPELAYSFGVEAFPSFTFLSPQGEWLVTVPGVYPAEEFVTMLEKVAEAWEEQLQTRPADTQPVEAPTTAPSRPAD